MSDSTNEAFIRRLIKSGHESVLEHSIATVRFVISRAIANELVRHRLASYSQESTRYVDYNKKQLDFIIPHWCTISEGTYIDYDVDFILDNPDKYSVSDIIWLEAMYDCENKYKSLRVSGVKSQDARGVLPLDTATTIVVSANYREWRHILKLRTSQAAHPDIRNIMSDLLDTFKGLIPVVFEDIDARRDIV